VTALSSGAQLYVQLTQLLAPAGKLEGALVILEPGGLTVGAALAVPGAAATEGFADLANSIPAAVPSFVDTGSRYDDVWGFVLKAATPTDGPAGPTVAGVIADNRSDFELMARSRIDDPAGLYRPVRPSPSDWLADDGWNQASFELGEKADPPSPPPGLSMPQDIPDLSWKIVDPEPVPGPPVPIPDPERLRLRTLLREAVVGPDPVRREAVVEPDPLPAARPRTMLIDERAVAATDTTASPTPSGFHLSFDYRVVSLDRPWLQPQLCHLSDWTIPGLPAHGLSNGELIDNHGLLPVLTTRMLVVRQLVLEADWSAADRAQASSHHTIAFGPFAVTGQSGFDGSRLVEPAPQVVAWLATVVPACPA
jgi:hypothetical protein